MRVKYDRVLLSVSSFSKHLPWEGLSTNMAKRQGQFHRLVLIEVYPRRVTSGHLVSKIRNPCTISDQRTTKISVLL